VDAVNYGVGTLGAVVAAEVGFREDCAHLGEIVESYWGISGFVVGMEGCDVWDVGED
jgi:hypothetical protein